MDIHSNLDYLLDSGVYKMARTEEEKEKLKAQKKEHHGQLMEVWTLFLKYWEEIVTKENDEAWKDFIDEYDTVWKKYKTDIVYSLGNWAIRAIEEAQNGENKQFKQPQKVHVHCAQCKYMKNEACEIWTINNQVRMTDYCSFGQWRIGG